MTQQLKARAGLLRRAHDPRAGLRLALTVGGVAAFAAGGLFDAPLGMVVGAGLIGYVLSPDPERYYLEGFSDGLVAADGLEAAFGPSRGTAPVGHLSGSPVADEPRAADGPRQPERSAPPGPSPRYDIRDAFGIPAGEGQSRPATGLDGTPLVSGPARTGFPSVPTAEQSRSPIVVPAARPSSRNKADRGKRQSSQPED